MLCGTRPVDERHNTEFSVGSSEKCVWTLSMDPHAMGELAGGEWHNAEFRAGLQ